MIRVFCLNYQVVTARKEQLAKFTMEANAALDEVKEQLGAHLYSIEEENYHSVARQ